MYSVECPNKRIFPLMCLLFSTFSVEKYFKIKKVDKKDGLIYFDVIFIFMIRLEMFIHHHCHLLHRH